MDESLMEIEGILTTQCQLIELLLGAHLARGDDPPGNVDKLRALLDKRFRVNMTALGMNPPEEFEPIRAAALKHLHQILDRVKAQVSRTKATKH